MKKQYITPNTQRLLIAPITTLMVGSGVPSVTGFRVNGGFINPADAGTGV